MTAKRMATDPPQEMPDSTRRRGPEAMEGVEDTLSSGPQNAKAVLSGTTNGSNGDLLCTSSINCHSVAFPHHRSSANRLV